MRLLFPALCLLLLSLPGRAQKDAYIWYFGNRAGLDFNTNPPTVLSNSIMNTGEGCASIANRNGRLLFYTDGYTIYNKNHTVMSNGSGLTGSSTSTQSGIIVQNPDSGHIYYVFTTYQVLAYSVVDTTRSGGLGAVTAKNITLLSPATEKLTAVRHANGRDVWVVSHRDASTSFYAYLVTGAGVNPTPVVSFAGTTLNGYSIGVIKLASNGKTMVSVDYFISANSVQLMDFDNANGTVSNARTLASGPGYYGAEFSPSGRYLYVGRYSSGPRLDQYDVLAGNITDIINSRDTIAKDTLADAPSTLQLAPDGRIYMAQLSRPYLSVINFPDNAGTACGYVKRGIYISPGTSQMGLPTFNQSFFQARVQVIHTCYKDTTLLSLLDSSDVDSLVWHFGDAASSEKISRLSKPGHVYSSPGTFQGKLYVYRRQTPFFDSTDFEVIITPPPVISTGADRVTCIGNPVLLAVTSSNSASTINWSHGLGTGSIKTVAPDTTTTYQVTAGCKYAKDTDEVTVYVRPPVKVNPGRDTIICSGQSVTIAAVAEGGDSSYTFNWDNGLGTGSTKTVAPLTTTTFRVIADDGCTYKKDTGYIKVSIRPAAGVSLGKDTTVCRGKSITLTPVVTNALAGYSLSWNNGLGTGSPKTVSPSAATTYVVTLSDGCSADVSDTVMVNVEDKPDVKFTCDTIVCEEELVSFGNLTTGNATYKYTWLFGDGSGSLLDEPEHIYLEQGSYSVTLVAGSSAGCSDSLVKTGYILVHPKPVAAFTTDPLFTDIEHPSVDMINLSSGADHYLWDFGDTTSSTQVSPVHVYARAALFPVTLIAATDEGCYDTALLNFRVKEVYHFYIPLSFSPNGDEFNDEFKYSCKGCATISMKIFNRWGEMVFSSSKVNEYWNGGMDNVLPALPEGVYAYVLDVRDSNKAMHHYKGTVTVIR